MARRSKEESGFRLAELGGTSHQEFWRVPLWASNACCVRLCCWGIRGKRFSWKWAQRRPHSKRCSEFLIPILLCVLFLQKRCWHRMSVGCSGGLQIPSAVAQVLINKLAFEDSLSESIERARVYYGVDTGLTEIEGMLLVLSLSRFYSTHVS